MIWLILNHQYFLWNTSCLHFAVDITHFNSVPSKPPHSFYVTHRVYRFRPDLISFHSLDPADIERWVIWVFIYVFVCVLMCICVFATQRILRGEIPKSINTFILFAVSKTISENLYLKECPNNSFGKSKIRQARLKKGESECYSPPPLLHQNPNFLPGPK